jgi:hypothetical protein
MKKNIALWAGGIAAVLAINYETCWQYHAWRYGADFSATPEFQSLWLGTMYAESAMTLISGAALAFYFLVARKRLV